MHLSILYRGLLSSCNYDCWYCPFAKHSETADELKTDEQALARFVDWVRIRRRRLSIFFTPWGEALVRRWYRDAIVQLTGMEHVRKVVIQTNLSYSPAWVESCNKERLALWTTYHPSQIHQERFLAKCNELDRRDVRFSVGVVGLKDDISQIEELRRELPSHVYLWINAYKDRSQYYSETDIRRFEAIDPLFRLNTVRHASRGRNCRTGHSVISVDGNGNARRCHFIREPIGNIYDPDFEASLFQRTCTNDTCGCHIGYVHLEELDLYDVFGSGILERIPNRQIWNTPNADGDFMTRADQQNIAVNRNI